MADKIRILLVDDQRILRESLAQALANFEGVSVIGGCGAISEAVEFLQHHSADVIVLDDTLAWEAGKLLLKVRSEGFQGSIVVLTDRMNISQGVNLVRHGISALCPKNESLPALVEIIRLAAQGVTSIDERYLRPALRSALTETAAPPREQLVIDYLKRGLNNREIAARIGVSVPRVRVVLHRLYRSRGVRTRGRLLFLLLQKEAGEDSAMAG